MSGRLTRMGTAAAVVLDCCCDGAAGDAPFVIISAPLNTDTKHRISLLNALDL